MGQSLKILLLGEYSNYFNSLAYGLKSLGHDVTLANNGDLYKNYYRDIDLSGYSNNLVVNTFTRIIRENLTIHKLKGYDIVQVINPNVFAAVANNVYLYKQIVKHNGNVFLSAVGDDYYWWQAYRQNKFEKAPHSGFLKDRNTNKAHWETHKGLKDANDYLAQNSKAIIPGSISYAIPYEGFENLAPTILQPIIIPDHLPSVKDHHRLDTINVYHGAQIGRYHFKGTPVIDHAFKQLKKENRPDLNLIRTDSLPYNEYLKVIDQTHVLIDQTNFIEPTMNALLSMLNAKIVLGGCEPIFMKYHNLNQPPLKNITNDPESVVQAIHELLDDREQLNRIATTGQQHVIKNHNAVHIAQQFVQCWEQFS